MATLVLTDATLWFGNIALHEISESLAFSQSLEPQDSTVFGHTSRAFRPGLFDAEISASGFADYGADGGYDLDLHTLLDTKATTTVSVAPESSDGGVAYTFQALHTDLQPLGGTVGDMAGLEVAAATRGGTAPVRGMILHPQTARTATGAGTARQVGAVSSTQRVYGALHVVAASGTTPTLDVVVESDNASNFPSATTRLTFAQATGRTNEFISAAGAITDDWWRISYTIGGTDPSFTFIVVVGIT